jgi:hypothetical protein
MQIVMRGPHAEISMQMRKAAKVDHGLTSETDRSLARAQIDAMVAKLYGITKPELQHILAQFPLVDSQQKEMVLRVYG